MTLNIKDRETEALVTEITALTGETEADALRQAARERLERLSPPPSREKRSLEEIYHWLETEVWPNIPEEIRGRGITKAEREEILGYGPDGV
jgi:antitoxin VapB